MTILADIIALLIVLVIASPIYTSDHLAGGKAAPGS